MSLYAGCELTDICVGVYDYTVTDTVTVFIAKELGSPVYEEKFTPTKNKWNMFTLSTPYPIDGSAIYIGYIQEGALYIYYSPAREADGAEYYTKSRTDWQEYTNSSYSGSVYGVMRGDKLPKHNVRLKSYSIPDYALLGEPVDIELTVTNLGAEEVTNLTVRMRNAECGMRNGEWNLELNLGYLSSTTITLEDVVFESVGDYDVSVSITAVNGEEDVDMRDNSTDNQQLAIREEFIQRKVLMELFSTEKCSSCPKAHTLLEGVLEDLGENVIEICHHAGYYTDQFTITESDDLTWFYDYYTTYNQYSPAVMLDRTNFYATYPDYTDYRVPFINPSNINKMTALITEALGQPAKAELEVTSYELRVTSEEEELPVTSYELRVSGSRLLPTGDSEIRLSVWLCEDSLVTTNQSGASGEFIYNATPRLCLTDSFGDLVDLDAGFEVEYEFSVDSEWVMENLKLVAFLSKYDDEDRNNCEVLNSAEVYLIERESEEECSIQCKKDKGQRTKDNVIYDIAGRKVENPGKGIYIKGGKKVVH